MDFPYFSFDIFRGSFNMARNWEMGIGYEKETYHRPPVVLLWAVGKGVFNIQRKWGKSPIILPLSFSLFFNSLATKPSYGLASCGQATVYNSENEEF